MSLYEQLSSIYNDKSSGILLSRNELKRLNPDYSLLRSEEEYEHFRMLEKENIVGDFKNIPHIMIDKYDDIKTYLKKLETSLSVDKIVMRILEL